MGLAGVGGMELEVGIKDPRVCPLGVGMMNAQSCLILSQATYRPCRTALPAHLRLEGSPFQFCQISLFR